MSNRITDKGNGIRVGGGRIGRHGKGTKRAQKNSGRVAISPAFGKKSATKDQSTVTISPKPEDTLENKPRLPAQVSPANGPQSALLKPGTTATADSVTGSTGAKTVDDIAKSQSNDKYNISRAADGKLRLERKVPPMHAYIITIHPTSSNLTNDQADQVGDVIARLLVLVDQHQNVKGGIKSVTFSGQGGHLKYHDQDKGEHDTRFGAPYDPDLGKQVHDTLKELETLLNRISPGNPLQVNCEHIGKADESDDKTPPASGPVRVPTTAEETAEAQKKEAEKKATQSSGAGTQVPTAGAATPAGGANPASAAKVAASSDDESSDGEHK